MITPPISTFIDSYDHDASTPHGSIADISPASLPATASAAFGDSNRRLLIIFNAFITSLLIHWDFVTDARGLMQDDADFEVARGLLLELYAATTARHHASISEPRFQCISQLPRAADL